MLVDVPANDADGVAVAIDGLEVGAVTNGAIVEEVGP